MPPTLVHGVDISTLEGWMVKINSNPSMFGKSHSRRWFRVSFVPAGNDQRLIISYSTSKTSKEPRGWLYIEDVSGVYCRRDMIEVVSPARTLRFKGETTVEHRLWSDSLHKLCNPPKATTAAEEAEEKRLVAESAALHERQRERLRSQDRDRIADPKKTREFVDSSREHHEEAKPTTRKSVVETGSAREPPPPRRRESSPDQRDPRRRDRRNNSSEAEEDDDDDHSGSSDDEQPSRRRQSHASPRERSPADHASSSRTTTKPQREPSPRDREPSPRSARRSDSTRQSPRDDDESEEEDERHRHPDSEKDESEESEDDDVKDAVRRAGAPLERRPSLLVASIKSLSPVVTTPAPPKSTVTDNRASETKASTVQTRAASPPRHRDAKAASHLDEDDNDEQDAVSECDDDPQNESPREQAAQEAVLASDVIKTTTTKSTDYFDDDEEEEDEETNNKRRPSIPMAAQPTQTIKAAPTSEIRADNNFADDDWDAEEPTPAPITKHRASPEKRASAGFGGVAADTNFATEDWD